MMILPSPQDLVRANEERVVQLHHEIHAPHSQDTRRQVRRWVGRQMVRWGARLAADPSLEPARSL